MSHKDSQKTLKNIQLIIAYDGTQYLGWQKTYTGPSIEESLQKILEQILQEPILLQAASRTDAGVHAHGQVVNFFTNKHNIDLGRLRISLNSLLPPDIAVLEAKEMTATFHPTLDCIGKEYRYTMCFGAVQIPQVRNFSWHYPHALNITKMHEASRILIGKHDFSSFCNFKKNAHYDDFVREVSRIDIQEFEHQRLMFIIVGNHFLYKMVRNLVGTLVYIGRGKLELESLPHILSGKDRTQAGMTAPAHGLTLHKVFY